VFAPLFVAAATGVSWQQAGLATGLVNTSQQRGSALGLAILSSVALAQINQHTTATPEALTDGYTAAFIGTAVLGLLVTATLIRSRDSRSHVQLSSQTKAAAQDAAGSYDPRRVGHPAAVQVRWPLC